MKGVRVASGATTARGQRAPRVVLGWSQRLRRAPAAVVAGDRPFVAATVALVVLAMLMLAGPVNRWLEGRERLAVLDEQRAALQTEVDRLEVRAADLNDPAHIELLAREQLGLVRPGEVPYVVVVPETDRPQLVPAQHRPVPATPWYRRLLAAVGDLFR